MLLHMWPGDTLTFSKSYFLKNHMEQLLPYSSPVRWGGGEKDREQILSSFVIRCGLNLLKILCLLLNDLELSF